MTVGLTPVMRDAMLVIQELIALDGRAPTYRELAHELSIADGGWAHRIVSDLVDRGWLVRSSSKNRDITVLVAVPAVEEYDIEVVLQPTGEPTT